MDIIKNKRQGDMINPVERSVREFYDTYGWSKGGEDELYRQFRPAYRHYHEMTVARTLGCFADRNGSLLIVGGGDLPPSHTKLALRFDTATCIDISRVALDITQSKLPSAKTVLGSICDAPLATATFDAVYAAHVIYHIDANDQERAIREMIRVTKPGGRIVIIYDNPRSPVRFAAGVLQGLRKRFAPEHAVKQAGTRLYFSAHPLSWWSRFKNVCSIQMMPWDIMGSYEERTLIPSDRLAHALYGAAARIERHFPSASVRLWQYPIIILDRK
jgi:SAM-dependent methyltransferase